MSILNMQIHFAVSYEERRSADLIKDDKCGTYVHTRIGYNKYTGEVKCPRFDSTEARNARLNIKICVYNFILRI